MQQNVNDMGLTFDVLGGKNGPGCEQCSGPMQSGNTAIICAGTYGKLDVADLLIRHGASVNNQNQVMWGKD